MTASDDHGALPEHASRLLATLDTIEQHHRPGQVDHLQHREYAKRARQLGDHLRSVLVLSDVRQYPSALVVVRAALEHHLMDRLIFLSTRYVETYGGIGKEDVPAEGERLARLKAGSRPDIERWWWDDQGMNVVIRGLHGARSRKGRGKIISPYYFLIGDFDPFTGGKKHADQLASPFWERSVRGERAAEAAAAWHRWFVHEKVIRGLNANRLLPGKVDLQVDVHYRFLSGYAHPSKRGYEAIHGWNYPDARGSFNHFASELSLLYVITIAASEVEIYGRMARRSPRLALSEWEAVESGVREARLASNYFWFLGGKPTLLDRIDTVHTTVRGRAPKWGRPQRDPAAIGERSVRYYSDPLDRLKRLHESWLEMTTGLSHLSPFKRR
jgi:hypothetical protein